MPNMLQHPEITWIERTGHPSWMQPKRDLDVDEDQGVFEDIDGYHNEDTIYEERREEAYGE